MPDLRRANCKDCGKHRDEVGPISWGGLCIDCSVGNVTANITDLATHSGDGFDRWRRGMAACVGATLAPSTSEAA